MAEEGENGDGESSARRPRCWCEQYDLTDLTKWAYRRYVEGQSTLSLLRRARPPYERDLVRIVSMLDVDEAELDRALGHESKPTCKLRLLRDHVKRWLHDITRIDA